MTAEVHTLLQAKLALEAQFAHIYVPYALYFSGKTFFDQFPERFVLIYPRVMRDRFSFRSDIGLHAVSVSNLGQLRTADGKKVFGEAGLNVMNSLSAKAYAELGVGRLMLSHELNLKQIAALSCDVETEVLGYGKIPLMVTQSCILKALLKSCKCKPQAFFELSDRMGKRFSVFANQENCTNTLYNCTPVCMSDKLEELKRCGVTFIRLAFTTETPQEMQQVLALYRTGTQATFAYTRGHYYRGV